MFTSYIFFSLLKNNACLFTTVTEDKLEDFWKTETTSKWICFSKLSIFFLKLKINFSVTGRIYIQIIIIKYGLMIRLFFMQKRRLFLNIQACQYRGLIKNFGRTVCFVPSPFSNSTPSLWKLESPFDSLQLRFFTWFLSSYLRISFSSSIWSLMTSVTSSSWKTNPFVITQQISIIEWYNLTLNIVLYCCLGIRNSLPDGPFLILTLFRFISLYKSGSAFAPDRELKMQINIRDEPS